MAQFKIEFGILAQELGRIGKGDRAPTLALETLFKANPGLDPDCERVFVELGIGQRLWNLGLKELG